MEVCYTRLKAAREKAGYTQEKVAEILGINQSTCTGYETGYRKPSIDILMKLADLYNVSIDWLVGRDK